MFDSNPNYIFNTPKHFNCTFLFVYYYLFDIGIMVRVFVNAPGDLGLISGRSHTKNLKMVLDASLLNTQHFKVRIEGKVEQSMERSSALPYTSAL